ncbi:hypothetical protein SADFL11_608 [Roseibium alexandrii DFL-11]|uniref:Uncharacterized protein n=2 Tax=Roseibium alexandrii TaxID=388408 RepID=A0A5E8GUV7_ROSAD|nr:hypothetical protein SADFL11_608 [Roseibium alexandrii DFL-11]
MRLFLSLVLIWMLSGTALADTMQPLGRFHVINTAGFIERDGNRAPLASDLETGELTLYRNVVGNLVLTISETDIELFEVENGLAGLTWNSGNSSLLEAADILDLSPHTLPEQVQAWGADVTWPGQGEVQLVLLPLGENAYSSFLISHPGSSTVVRQMELRKVSGPPNRPAPKATVPAPVLN